MASGLLGSPAITTESTARFASGKAFSSGGSRKRGSACIDADSFPDGCLDLGTVHLAVNDYLGGIDHAEGKFPLQDEEGVTGEGAFRD